MKKIVFLTSFLLFINFSIFGQLEASNWFFGTAAGLDFDPLPVQPQTGQLNTLEGCSSISDPSGNLLFYTDGITVYDANHNVMPNGTGLFGDSSSSQSGLIVPHPGNPDLYFVISVDANGGTNGLRYSVVDMSMNGGLGAVVAGQKNILLINHIEEKVTAVANVVQDFVWVVTIGPAPNGGTTIPVNTFLSPRNTIYAIRIDNTGIVNTVVASTISGLNLTSTHGYLKISTQGDKLGIAGYYDEQLFLLDFDINTGVASNMRVLTKPANFAPYGIEFSPSGDYMYVSGTNDGGSTSHASISLLQYDLTVTPYNYVNLLPANAQGYRAALQLGIDGRIYMAEPFDYGTGTGFVTVINNPDNPGASAGVSRNAVALNSGTVSQQGLPQFIQSFFVQIQTENVCVGETATFRVSSNRAIDHVDWDFGDGNVATSPPLAGDPNASETTHVYTAPGTYTVTATITNTNNQTRSISTQIEIYPLPDIQNVTDYEVCDMNQNGFAQFTLHTKDSEVVGTQSYPGTFSVKYYGTMADATAQVNELSDPYTNTTAYNQTVYYVLENMDTGCSDIGSLNLVVHPLPQIFNVPDMEVCDDDFDGLATFNLLNAEPDILNGRNASDYTIVYYETQADAENQTNPVNPPDNFQNTTPDRQTVYYTITDNQTGCVNIGSFDVVVNPKPEINMDDKYIVCLNDSVYVEAPAGFSAYLWSTGETTQGIYIYNPGTYTVEVTDAKGCTNSKDIQVALSEPATITDVIVVDFNGNDNSIEVMVAGSGDYEYSLDDVNYQDSNIFTGLPPGDYTVYVNDKNNCGKVHIDVQILGAPPYFSPNGDGISDYWQIINIAARPGSKIYIYDRFGKLMYQMDHTDIGWDGTYNGMPQPSTDYWFLVELRMPDDSVKIIKGHFSLIR